MNKAFNKDMHPIGNNILLKTKPATDSITTTAGIQLFVDTSYNVYHTNSTKAKIVEVSDRVRKKYKNIQDYNYALVHHFVTRGADMTEDCLDKSISEKEENGERLYIADIKDMVYAFLKIEKNIVTDIMACEDNFILAPLALHQKKLSNINIYNERKYHNAVAKVLSAPQGYEHLKGSNVVISPFSDNLVEVFPEYTYTSFAVFVTKQDNVLAVLEEKADYMEIDIYHHVPPHINYDLK